MFRGELRPARRSLARAVELARDEAHGLDGSFKAQHNLGYVEFLAGDLPLALRLMDEAGALETQGRPAGCWLLDRARILSEAGLFREADEALSEAAKIFRRDRLAPGPRRDRARTRPLLPARRRPRGGAPASPPRREPASGAAATTRWRRAAELVWLQARPRAGRGRRPAGGLASPRCTPNCDAAGLG